MNNPKRHHFVPQLLLKRFTNDEGLLYFYDKRRPENGVCCTGPSNLFVESHFYSELGDDGGQDPWLERILAKLESNTEPILQRIIESARKGELPNLSQEEKEIWDYFLYYQWKRVPDSLDRASGLEDFDAELQRTLDRVEKDFRKLTDEEWQRFRDPDYKRKLRQNVKVDVVARIGPDVLKIIKYKGLGIGVIENPKKSFVIGSNPVVKLTYRGQTHLADPSVELWLPISSDIAILLLPSHKQEKLLPLSDENVRHLNRSILSQSTVVACRSESLIRSLVNPR